MIVLFGLNDPMYPGAAKAVADLEAEYGALLMISLGDARGTAVVIHP